MTPEIKQRIQQIRQGKTPKGYKKTKEGIIPDAWNVKPVGECIEEYRKLSNDIRTYTVYSSSRNGLIPQSDYYDQKEAVETNKGYNLVPKGYITYRHMSDDDIFHFNINTTGSSILVSNEYPVFTTNCKFNTYFLVSALNESKRFLAFCKMQKKGGTRTRLYLSNLKQYPLPLPPLPEQTAIAEILSTQDRVIELKEQLLAEKKRQKKYLMQQLLTGKMRLKGFKGEWKKCRLGEVAKFSKGYGYSKSDISINGEIPIILYGRLYTNYKTIIKDIDTYTNTKIRNAVFSKGNEVIVPASGETAEDIAIASCIEPEGVILGGDLNIIYPNETILPSYLANLISYGPLHLELSKKAQGKSVVHLHNDDLSNVIIEFSPLPEQTAIAEILSTADREIELLGQSIEAEKRKKKSLMQLLLTGIVRVP